ncbi:hypothetical protein GWI33_008814 [Rhynchophorus ferrugineus]|uniref:Uncharacterized protein n=1 Tax=Rhynchophorus ferrugineus TaxID=354439 RepID=A0A834IBC7_RHYFE|nr:hypothetical protein GWI33_008814 [Rhynchophorus ferrugineus]
MFSNRCFKFSSAAILNESYLMPEQRKTLPGSETVNEREYFSRLMHAEGLFKQNKKKTYFSRAGLPPSPDTKQLKQAASFLANGLRTLNPRNEFPPPRRNRKGERMIVNFDRQGEATEISSSQT